MSKTNTVKRTVTVLVRYFIKKDHTTKDGKVYRVGDVVLLVENDQLARYYITLRRRGGHSCTCKATKRCYHINHCADAENARAARENTAKRQAVARQHQTLAAMLATTGQTTVEALLARSSLGSNRGFSLMRPDQTKESTRNARIS